VAELARGRTTDRPWGRTLSTLATRGLSGQLDVLADGRAYSIAFQGGVVVGAASPLPNDSAVRVAMTMGLVSSTQVSDLSRRLAAAAGRDEIEVIAEAMRLPADQALRLRRRVLAQRAARTFSIESGEFVIVDKVSVPVVPGAELDIRSVVYLGARGNLTDLRLDAELSHMGTTFQLKADAAGDLPYFGFADGDRVILQRLSRGASLADLQTAAPEIDAHTQRAIVYALVTCGAVDATGVVRSAPAAASAPAPVRMRTPTGVPPAQVPTGAPAPAPVRTQVPTGQPPMATPAAASAPAPVRMRTPTGQPPMATTPAGPQRAPAKPTTARARRNTAETREAEALIKQKLVDAYGDHFQLLGVPPTASADEIRSAYFTLARKLHPDRLSSLGIADDNRDAQRLFAQINTAFAVLNDEQQRHEYVSVMSRGGEAAVRAQEAEAEEMAARVMRAEEAFKRGEMALRRDALEQALALFTEAVELQPKETEFQALLAWTRFAIAPDKNAVAADTRKTLQHAAEAAPKSPTSRFYLGRVERMLGREREALAHFQDVLRLKPGHAEAASELRLLEQRLKKR
jgi:hypothetical protein